MSCRIAKKACSTLWGFIVAGILVVVVISTVIIISIIQTGPRAASVGRLVERILAGIVTICIIGSLTCLACR